VWQQVLAYAVAQRHRGVPANAVLRHCLGLCHGLSGARHWRGILSDPRALAAMSDAALLALELPRGVVPSLAGAAWDDES
jgi:hypothetical protein